MGVAVAKESDGGACARKARRTAQNRPLNVTLEAHPNIGALGITYTILGVVLIKKIQT